MSTLPFEIDERIDDADPDIERDHRADLASRVVLDAPTAKRMTKAVMSILRSIIGPMRRGYLVIDTPASLAGADLFARRAPDTKPAEPARDS